MRQEETENKARELLAKCSDFLFSGDLASCAALLKLKLDTSPTQAEGATIKILQNILYQGLLTLPEKEEQLKFFSDYADFLIRYLPTQSNKQIALHVFTHFQVQLREGIRPLNYRTFSLPPSLSNLLKLMAEILSTLSEVNNLPKAQQALAVMYVNHRDVFSSRFASDAALCDESIRLLQKAVAQNNDPGIHEDLANLYLMKFYSNAHPELSTQTVSLALPHLHASANLGKALTNWRLGQILFSNTEQRLEARVFSAYPHFEIAAKKGHKEAQAWMEKYRATIKTPEAEVIGAGAEKEKEPAPKAGQKTKKRARPPSSDISSSAEPQKQALSEAESRNLFPIFCQAFAGLKAAFHPLKVKFSGYEKLSAGNLVHVAYFVPPEGANTAAFANQVIALLQSKNTMKMKAKKVYTEDILVKESEDTMTIRSVRNSSWKEVAGKLKFRPEHPLHTVAVAGKSAVHAYHLFKEMVGYTSAQYVAEAHSAHEEAAILVSSENPEASSFFNPHVKPTKMFHRSWELFQKQESPQPTPTHASSSEIEKVQSNGIHSVGLFSSSVTKLREQRIEELKLQIRAEEEARKKIEEAKEIADQNGNEAKTQLEIIEQRLKEQEEALEKEWETKKRAREEAEKALEDSERSAKLAIQERDEMREEEEELKRLLVP